jgi:hypothetical protein
MVAFSAIAAIQQARAAAFFSLTQQAAVQFAIIEDDVKIVSMVGCCRRCRRKERKK